MGTEEANEKERSEHTHARTRIDVRYLFAMCLCRQLHVVDIHTDWVNRFIVASIFRVCVCVIYVFLFHICFPCLEYAEHIRVYASSRILLIVRQSRKKNRRENEIIHECILFGACYHLRRGESLSGLSCEQRDSNYNNFRNLF